MAEGVVRAADLAAAARLVQSGTGAAAVVEGYGAAAASSGTVKLVHESRHHIVLETESAGPGYLVTAEAGYPGWQASVDGKPVPWYYTNAAFRGLPTPAGRRRVEFTFEAPRARVGIAVSFLTLAALIALRRARWPFRSMST
jgi:uncharacterized membrane protein YfhO